MDWQGTQPRGGASAPTLASLPCGASALTCSVSTTELHVLRSFGGRWRATMQDPAPRRRCGIYTRKSAVPPLGQEVTSLQSQRAICSSYIVSQQHKGWSELPAIYEDS